MFIINSTCFIIKLINNIINLLYIIYDFDELEMKYRNTIIVESSNFPKPSLIEYRDYLNKYFDNIMQFIDYHLELEESYNNLPKITNKFLYQMQQRLLH